MALTAKQEVFCQCVAVRKMTQTEAYSTAYDTSKMKPATITANASTLAQHKDVAARIEVLRERATKAAVKSALLTREQSLSEAGQLLEDAQVLGQISAGVAAAKLRAQLSGHLDEKKQAPIDALADLDVERLLELKAAVEDKVARSREALEMTGDAPTVKPVAAPIRRVIG